MILQKIKKSIEKIGIPCFLDYNDATYYCAVLIPETNGKESIKVDIQFIWEDGNPILLADEWIKSLRMNKELKAIVLGSGNNYAGYVLRVKVIDVSICSYIPVDDTPKYNISIDNDSSMGTVSGAGQYKEGKTCTISCTPFEQYYFDGWDKFVSGEDNWESAGTIYDNPYRFTVDQDLMFEAIYGNKYHVEVVSAGNGTVSGSGYYEPTESCTITATPNTGYHFVNWTVNGLELTTDNPYTFIPTGDITITANFVPYYNISVLSSGNGSVSGGGTYNSGETVSLTATPDSGYRLVNWTENGVEVSTSNPYTFTCTGNRTIVGNFEEFIPLVINCSASSSVVLTNSSNQTYTLNLSAGENVYEGDVPGFALDEITGLKKGNNAATYDNVISIDAIGLTSWTTVEQQSFDNCSNLTSITLPNTITSIGQKAFYYCSSLTSITLSNSLTTIENDAIRNCSSLTSITLPNSLTTIGEYVFYGCNSLTFITLSNSLTTIGQYAFYNCVPSSLTLPSTLTSIGNRAFYNNSKLNSITCLATIPPTLGSDALSSTNDCPIYVPVDSVNDYKTAWTSYAYRIAGDIPEPTEDNLFVECKNITSVILTNSNSQTYTLNLSAGRNYYTGTEPGFSINEITGLKRGNSNVNNIVSIDASDLTSWTTVENQAFSSCSSLTSITLPNSITTLGYSAVSGCSKLTSITLPDSLTTIESDVFANCNKLESLHIPANVSSIAQRIGYALQSLASITVDPNNVKYSDGNGSNCLIENDKLILGSISAVIPNNITYISGYAFHYMPISSITLPDSITTIESYAFGNTALTSINLSANVSFLGFGAFNSCFNLTSITIDSNNVKYNDGNGGNCIIETATNKLITGCNNTTIPNTVVALGDYAFQGCTFTSITLPSSLTTIGQNVFSNCSNLQTLTIPASVNNIGNSAFWSYLWYIEFEGTTPATLQTTSIFLSNYPIYVPSSAVSDYQTAWPTYASRIQAKPQPSGSDYLRVDTSGNTEVILTNANNDTYTWTIPGAGINYYEGTEPGFAINEITGLKKSSRLLSSIKIVDASKLTSWTTVENQAFDNCQGLISFKLPNSITTIGSSAFNYCVKLTSLTLPDTLTSIDSFAFNGSRGLTSITFLSTTPPTLGSSVFNQTNNCPIYVPAASVNDYKTAPVWSNYADRIQPIS